MDAASSLHTRPSHNAIAAPSTQPSMHCGPPIDAMMSGMVMNGPTPTMLLMLSAVASSSPRPRIKRCSAIYVSARGPLGLRRIGTIHGNLVIEETDHHLLECLIAPMHGLRRIRIVL